MPEVRVGTTNRLRHKSRSHDSKSGPIAADVGIGSGLGCDNLKAEDPNNSINRKADRNSIKFNDMGSPDYREQFTYAAKELNEFGLAYLHVMDGLGFGFHELGEAMTLADFRKVFDGPLMGNCGYTQESAEQAVTVGDADLISFGRPYISNPDLVYRFENGIDLNPEADMSDWYSPTGAKGYTDFPMVEEAKAQ